MKKILFKYGLIAALALMVLFSISYFVLDPESMSYDAQEIFGYLSILVSLSFVFFGVKAYRDKELNGQITFGRALGMGMMITLFPALMFGLFDAIYVSVLNPDFYDDYYTQMYQDLSQQYSGEVLKAKQAEMETWKDLASNPLFTFSLMAFTVVLMGFVVSLITSVVLRKKDIA